MPFSSAHPSLQAALARREYATPTPVQAAVLAADAKERDLLVSAQTGSGKTVAFGLALAPQLLGEAARFDNPAAPLALVVAPTRELAQQVHRELLWLYADTGARITTCVGGFDPRRETHLLSQGVHIVVGTPGRLCDHLERGALVLSKLQALVLDEADEMLDMGFREDLERILQASPETRRTLLFSATIPRDIAAIAKRYQKTALRIQTQAEHDAHRDIAYHALPIVPRERDLAVVNVLRYHDAVGALVFCNTRDAVTHLAANLNERGFSVVALSGELSQRERNVALQSLRDGRARVCVATDVAARGLDLPDLGLVIHAELPQNKQALVHRSGRTGRAGRRGVAIMLVPDAARRYVERTLQSAHIEAQWMRPPTAEQIYARDQEQLVREIGTMTDELGDDDRAVAKTLLAEKPAEDLVAMLVRQLRKSRPAAEVLTDPPSMRPARPGDNRREDPRRDVRGPDRGFDRGPDRGADRGPGRDTRFGRTSGPDERARPAQPGRFERHDVHPRENGPTGPIQDRRPLVRNDRPPLFSEGASTARRNDRPPLFS
ncbi:MAG: DEAD/DEAH box helicase, partial [Myxococcota bacterium]|nr:DEAD/DEAH box helicase [Myxococcota bacterium]